MSKFGGTNSGARDQQALPGADVGPDDVNGAQLIPSQPAECQAILPSFLSHLPIVSPVEGSEMLAGVIGRYVKFATIDPTMPSRAG